MKVAFGNTSKVKYYYSKPAVQQTAEFVLPKGQSTQLPNCISLKPLPDEDLNKRRELKSLAPLMRDENGKFSIDKAAELLKSKIDKQLMLYSTDDIKNVVSTVMAQNPKATRKEILTAMEKLSSFSNYKSLEKIEDLFKQEGITEIIPTESLSVNSIFSYLSSSSKRILRLQPASLVQSKKKALFVDRNTISELEEYKKSNPEKLSQLKDDILSGKTKLVILDGWEAKTKDGLTSFNICGAWNDLAKSVNSILEEKPQNDVFNSDIIENLNKIFKQNVPVSVISNPIDNLDEATVAQRFNEKTLSTDFLKKFLIGISIYSVPNYSSKSKIPKSQTETSEVKQFLKTVESGIDKERATAQESIAKVLYATMEVNSPRRIAFELKKLHSKLADKVSQFGKNMDDALFLIPRKEKSFGFINYQYSKVNNVSPKQFAQIQDNTGVQTHKSNYTENGRLKREKFFVFMDDFSGSGQSMLAQLLPYIDFREHNIAQDFIFAPLVYTKQAEKKITDTILLAKRLLRRNTNDCLVGGIKAENAQDYIKVMPSNTKYYPKHSISDGYSKGYVSVYFPHIVPDNCSDLAGFLFKHMLKSSSANKSKIDEEKKNYIIFQMRHA